MYGAEGVVINLLSKHKGSVFSGILGCIRESHSDIPLVAAEARRLGIKVEFFTMKRGLNIQGINKIKSFLKKNSIQIVHCHGYKPNIFLSLIQHRSIKVLSTVHGWAKQGSGIKAKVYEWLDSLALQRMDRVIAVSKAVSRDLEHRKVKDGRISVIYNGITFDEVDSDPSGECIRDEYRISNGDFVVGAVGRLVAVKGFRYLIDAMAIVAAKVPNCKLLIAGDGPLQNELTTAILDHNLSSRISLVGYQKPIIRFLNEIDLFVMSSLSEGLPIALLEAMACGKAIVATAVGGITEAVENERSALLVSSRDPDSIAAGILRLYVDRVLRDEMGMRNRSIVRDKFSAERMVQEYEAIYSELLGGGLV
jgi:glycosyltransferase involved in cell wall biosynthesis